MNITPQAATLNSEAAFYPGSGRSVGDKPAGLPMIELGGVQVYAYAEAIDGHLRLVVSVDLDTVQEELLHNDLVPILMKVQGDTVWSA